jgi:hypothetical protein
MLKSSSNALAVAALLLLACGSNSDSKVDAGGHPDDGGTSADAGNPNGPFTVASFDTGCLSVPDPDVSASPELVGTAIQWTAYFHKKDGTLDHTYKWEAHRGSLISDSHIVFDPEAQKWFITTIVDLGGDHFGVQIMASTDATAKDWKASVPIEMPRLIDDPQPTITKDKVVITESGSCVWAVDKDALIAGDAPSVDAIRCDLAQNNQIAATKLGTPQPSTAYAITMADETHLNWVSVEGTPGESNLVATEHKIAVDRVDEVPTFGGIKQFGTFTESGQVKAMWQKDHLAWTKTVWCGQLSCVRLFDVDTATNTATSTDLSLDGTQLFYGGAGIDKYGNTWVLMAAAKPDGAVGLALAGVRASGQVEPAQIVVEGKSKLSGDRFGDYFAATQDPADGSVWLIGQYASTDSDLNPENSAGCRVVHVTVN